MAHSYIKLLGNHKNVFKCLCCAHLLNRVWPFVTPKVCSPPSSSVHEIFQARILEWVAMPSSRVSSWPRDQTQVLYTTGGFFTDWATREVHSHAAAAAAAAAAKSHQSCPTLYDPIDGSPPGFHHWDSPGKNAGVGSNFLLQCMEVKSESEVAQSCPTLHDPMDSIAYQAPPSMGFSRQEYWSGVPLPSPILMLVMNYFEKENIKNQESEAVRRL